MIHSSSVEAWCSAPGPIQHYCITPDDQFFRMPWIAGSGFLSSSSNYLLYSSVESIKTACVFGLNGKIWEKCIMNLHLSSHLITKA
jgi:hypothetical protein